MTITGKTRCLPIIGRPVAGVFSPPAFNAWFDRNGLDCRMMAFDLGPDAVAPFLSVLRGSESFVGCSVTYPDKQSVFAQVDDTTARAARLGALNTIRREPDGRLAGDATDGIAMTDAIEQRGGTVEGSSALVLGAGGGAGRAIADALCECGLSRLVLMDLDARRLGAAVSSIAEHWPDVTVSTAAQDTAILVNATTLGKEPKHILPFDSARLRNADVVCDVVTSPGDTSLIEQARGFGRIAISGADMGAAQLRPQLTFLGLAPADAVF
ncbi:hypothetical protein [Aestuariicoccus sp. MJ-SS9]|uniref:shikimate dehydrogenase family protein n=1 Tax=Aestuariicoccus sp. MJ-SS9 TaxID=3079855 RepID=UPI00291132D8|nr:hypothetical protein [Aestuariicoccus sp. MJ-SS9]MDU8913830.1 hypothetical protein [Aestuariicoccus sp. MJ-SS9]